MTTDLTKIEPRQLAMRLVLDSLGSPKSRAVYSAALNQFFDWWDRKAGKPTFSKMLVNEYRQVLLDTDLAPATVNLALCSIRKLALEAGDNGFLDPNVAAAIGRVPNVAHSGRRMGHWLSKEEAEELLSQPDVSSLIGKRDKAILSVMVGSALRRAEVVALTVEHFQQRDGRWVILDLVGKGRRVRTVPIPDWTKETVDDWLSVAGIVSGVVFVQVRKGNHVTRDPLSDRAVYDIIARYSDAAPHDLRRTWAKLAHEGGAKLDQISLSLGHASLMTTERYLGLSQDLEDAPCDYLGIGG